MKIKQLSIITLSLCLSACGGSNSDDASVDRNDPPDFPSNRALYAAPSTPDATEQAKIDAGKDHYVRPIFANTTAQSQRFILDGHTIYTHMLTGNGVMAHVQAQSLPQGFADRSVSSDVNGAQIRQNVRSYQGFRSGIMVLHNEATDAQFTAPFGYATPLNQVPTQGKATYSGVAFDRQDKGNLKYHVDFYEKSGQGEITGLTRFGTITLHKATYAYLDAPFTKNFHNVGEATAANGSSLRYTSALYGDKAEEVVGEISTPGNNVVGFHGTRGEITE